MLSTVYARHCSKSFSGIRESYQQPYESLLPQFYRCGD